MVLGSARRKSISTWRKITDTSHPDQTAVKDERRSHHLTMIKRTERGEEEGEEEGGWSGSSTGDTAGVMREGGRRDRLTWLWRWGEKHKNDVNRGGKRQRAFYILPNIGSQPPDWGPVSGRELCVTGPHRRNFIFNLSWSAWCFIFFLKRLKYKLKCNV